MYMTPLSHGADVIGAVTPAAKDIHHEDVKKEWNLYDYFLTGLMSSYNISAVAGYMSPTGSARLTSCDVSRWNLLFM